jgi:hypothetical protein
MSVVHLIVATRSNNIFIGIRIIKEMPDSVARGTPYILSDDLKLSHIFKIKCLLLGLK